MPIVRVIKRSHPFVQIDKRPLEDKKLSWKAKGLLAYLLSRRDDWVISVEHLGSVSIDGRTAVQSGLRELKAAGYAKLKQTRSLDGTKAAGTEWVVFEDPTLTDGFSDSQEKQTLRESAPNKKGSDKKNGKNKGIFPELPLLLRRLDPEWQRWLKYRREVKRKPVTPHGATMQIDQMLEWGLERSRAALIFSMRQEYTGLFEPNNATKKTTTKKALSSEDFHSDRR